MSTSLVWLGVLGAVSIGVFLICDRSERRKALRHMQGRPSRDPREYGRQHFSPGQAGIATRVVEVFGKHISIDISRAHPDDDLVRDLRMDALDSLSTVEFLVDLEKEFKMTIPEGTAAQLRTLRQLTDFIDDEQRSK